MNKTKEVKAFDKIALIGGEGIGKTKYLEEQCATVGKFKFINTPHLVNYEQTAEVLDTLLEEHVEIFVFDEIQSCKLSVLEAIIEFSNKEKKMIFNFSERDPDYALPAYGAVKQWFHTNDTIRKINFEM